MKEENLEKLTINYLSEEQYNTAKENGELNENELYFTPDYKDNSYTIAFDDENNTSFDIALSESVANYNYALIFFKDDNNNYNSTIVSNPNGKTISLKSAEIITNAVYEKNTLYTISNKNISVKNGFTFKVTYNGNPIVGTYPNVNIHKITKVMLFD